jgi:hypothetical protein
MKNILDYAIFIETDYSAWVSNKDGKAHPIFRDIQISNITCNGAAVAALVNGKPKQLVERIVMKNIYIKAEKGMIFNWVNDLKLINVQSEPAKGEPKLFTNCRNVDQGSVPQK